MKTRHYKERVDVLYRTRKNITELLTPCKMVGSESKESMIMIGSASCLSCDHFIARDNVQKFVICDHPKLR